MTVDLSKIREHMEVVGADGVHVGTVDKVEGQRIKLTKADSGMGSHKGHTTITFRWLWSRRSKERRSGSRRIRKSR